MYSEALGGTYRSLIPTPFGAMLVGVDERGVVVQVSLPNRVQGVPQRTAFPEAAANGMHEAVAQLDEYFAGKRREFDVPIEPHGTGFEISVWERLRAIPFGATTSYGAIAEEMGLVNGARAVGRANGANPIPIIIPCHRVIGAGGDLTGFGGGLPLKRALLELEGAIPPPDPMLF